jgi:hypothetical protein
MKLLAFSINSMDVGDSVLRLFEELQASVVKTRAVRPGEPAF